MANNPRDEYFWNMKSYEMLHPKHAICYEMGHQLRNMKCRKMTGTMDSVLNGILQKYRKMYSHDMRCSKNSIINEVGHQCWNMKSCQVLDPKRAIFYEMHD